MIKIDLHGYTVDEASATIINALFEFQLDKHSRMFEIICGKGTGAIKNTVEEILINDNYDYDEQGDRFIVYKEEIADDFDF